MKPGIQTTEFWSLVMKVALVAGVNAGILTKADMTTASTALPVCVAAVATLWPVFKTVEAYIASRVRLKLAEKA